MLGLSDIARIFEEIEMLLVRSLKRNLSRHKKEEEQEGFNWSAWQAEKLREIDRFRQENAQTVADFADQIDQETRQVMQEQFDEGVNGAEVPPAQNVEDAPAQVTPQPQFFGVDDTKVNKLIDDVTHLEKNVETAALRTMDDVYRQVVNKAQIAMSTGAMTLQQAIDSAVSDFLARGIDCIVYRDGRRVNIADYVRMALRTTATRAGLQGKSAKYKAMGYDTVLVSSYGMCSPTCAPWQGKIYIEDTFSMWDGEVQEYPDGTLWGKSNYCGKWFPLLSSAIEHGLFHPNCRHSINFWKDGDPIPESIDNTDSERRYKLEQKQRALEREVRRAKRKVEGFSDPENIRKAKAELKAAQKKLKDFIDQTNAAEGKVILKRDKNKEKIYGAPSPPVQSAPAAPVDVPDTPKVTPAEVTLDAPQAQPDAYRDTPVPKREGLIMGSSDVHESSDQSDEGDTFERLKNMVSGNSYLNAVSDFEKALPNVQNETVSRLLERAKKGVIYKKSRTRINHFSAKENTIFLTGSAEPSSIAHELFHKIDHDNEISKRRTLDSCISSDYVRLMKKAESTGQSLEDMLYLSYPEAFESKGELKVEYRGISDILHGMSNTRIDLGYGHYKKGYWQKKSKLPKETFAQYGRMYFEENPEVIKMLGEIFPDITSQINVILKAISSVGR